jgi:hypothetical protein
MIFYHASINRYRGTETYVESWPSKTRRMSKCNSGLDHNGSGSCSVRCRAFGGQMEAATMAATLIRQSADFSRAAEASASHSVQSK